MEAQELWKTLSSMSRNELMKISNDKSLFLIKFGNSELARRALDHSEIKAFILGHRKNIHSKFKIEIETYFRRNVKTIFAEIHKFSNTKLVSIKDQIYLQELRKKNVVMCSTGRCDYIFSDFFDAVLTLSGDCLSKFPLTELNNLGLSLRLDHTWNDELKNIVLSYVFKELNK